MLNIINKDDPMKITWGRSKGDMRGSFKALTLVRFQPALQRQR